QVRNLMLKIIHEQISIDDYKDNKEVIEKTIVKVNTMPIIFSNDGKFVYPFYCLGEVTATKKGSIDVKELKLIQYFDVLTDKEQYQLILHELAHIPQIIELSCKYFNASYKIHGDDFVRWHRMLGGDGSDFVQISE